MRSENSVCYGCPRRTAICHATCPEHTKERQKNADRMDRCRKNAASNYTIHDSRRVNLKYREHVRKDHWNY